MQECAGDRGQRPLEGWCELVGPVNPFGVHAVGVGQGNEVGIHEISGRNATRMVEFLVHPDGAPRGVVHDQNHRQGACLDGRPQFRERHLDVAVPGETDDGPVRVDHLGGDGCRKAVAHGAVLRGQEPGPRSVEQKLVGPHREVASPVGHHHVVR